MPVTAGNAIWFEDNGEGLHLWVVLNTPTETETAIFINFTDFDKCKEPPIEIPAKYVWLPPSGMTSKRTTIHVKGAFLVTKSVLEREFAKTTVFNLCPRLLGKIQAIIMSQKCEKDVLDRLAEILITGWK